MPPQQPVELAQSYTLLTENLILTQLTLHLGFHRYSPSQSWFKKMYQDVWQFRFLHVSRTLSEAVFCAFLIYTVYDSINPCGPVLFASLHCVCRLHEQMVKMNQSLHRLQVTWQEAQRTGNPMSEQLLEQFERLMIVYLSTKAATTQPAMLQCCLNLQASTAALLVQLGIGNQGPEHVALSFPLPSVPNTMLCYIPGR